MHHAGRATKNRQGTACVCSAFAVLRKQQTYRHNRPREKTQTPMDLWLARTDSRRATLAGPIWQRLRTRPSGSATLVGHACTWTQPNSPRPPLMHPQRGQRSNPKQPGAGRTALSTREPAPGERCRPGWRVPPPARAPVGPTSTGRTMPICGPTREPALRMPCKHPAPSPVANGPARHGVKDAELRGRPARRTRQHARKLSRVRLATPNDSGSGRASAVHPSWISQLGRLGECRSSRSDGT